MELLQYWRLVVQNRIMIAACTVLGLIAAIAITFTTTPTYESQSQIFVSTPASTLDISALATGSSFSQQRVKSYAQIINSPMTLKPVIEKLRLNLTPQELGEMVSATAPLDTVLITLTVTYTDPQLASEIANEVADQFGVTVGELELHGIGSDSPVKVSTVKYAIPANGPSSPKKLINYALGILLGFGAGIGLASLRRLLDNTIQNEDDLKEFPLLAAVGFDKLADEKPLVTQIGRYSARTEAFRTLRTNLQYLAPKSHPQVIVFTSALSGEGKSTSASNLALSLKQAGVKTLLIEADLRRPMIPSYLEMSELDNGLTQVLLETKKITTSYLKALIKTEYSTSLEVLLAGKIPQNPAELLGSPRFDEVISHLRKMYEYIIIDCPPLLLVTDAAVVAAKADGAVLIVHAGATKKPHFKGSCDALSAVGSKVLGVVLNKIPEKSLEYEYGYRYGYPRYYGSNYIPNNVHTNIYQPRDEVLARFELEDSFEFIKGKRFKEELMRQTRPSTRKSQRIKRD